MTCNTNDGGHEPSTTSSSNGLNKFNVVNVVAYLLNVFVTFGIGLFRIGGRPTNGELSDRYQTLVTPSGYAFSIWGPIFILQAAWMLWQLIPSQRNHAAVRAVGFGYLYACLAQAGWTLSFSWEIMWLALLFMFGILATLIRTMASLQGVKYCCCRGYFIWQFPFSMHTGWICAATAVNVNLLFVYYNASVATQIAVAAVSVVALLVGAVGLLALQNPLDYTIPAVLVWALTGVYVELQSPQDSILQKFTPEQIKGIAMGCIAGAAVILFGMLVKIVYACVFQRPCENNGTSEIDGVDVESPKDDAGADTIVDLSD